MSDEQQELPITQDGSVEAAAAAMPDLSYLDSPKAEAVRDREANGRFAKTPADNVVELKPNNDAAKAVAEQEVVEDDDDDPEVEIPGAEEGVEPARHKLSAIVAGYQRATQLETEIENVRKTAPMPVDYEAGLREFVGVQHSYMKALEEFAQYNQPRWPSEELLNPQSQHYNPDLFGQMLTAAKKREADIKNIKAEHEKLAKDTADKQGMLDKAFEARESAKRKEIWPEYETEAGRKQVYADVERHYGLKGTDLDDVRDHRAIHIIKDALAYRASQVKQQQAVKIVKAKPKLIPSQARGTGNSKQAAAADAMQRLGKSGSMDDAVAALDALLG